MITAIHIFLVVGIMILSFTLGYYTYEKNVHELIDREVSKRLRQIVEDTISSTVILLDEKGLIKKSPKD
jgi:hypothetical protein